MYKVLFPNTARQHDFEKVITKVPKDIQDKIMAQIELLASEPRPSGNPKISPPIPVGQFIAQYRIRIGNYRVLYDIDDTRQKVWIIALRIRSEKTYK